MGQYPTIKQHGCKRCGKCICAITAVVAALFLVLSASVLSPALIVNYPFHAECELTWRWTDTNCSFVKEALINIATKWKGSTNCDDGGEKCLYDVTSVSEAKVEMTHTTPKQKFVDDISFQFCNDVAHCGKESHLVERRMKRAAEYISKVKFMAQDGKGCAVSGFSKSEVWYAILDYGTNYCNMRNLADGAKLSSKADFSEEVSDDACTQYSSSDCNTY